jgi:Flp pilus assembly protein TadB
VSGAKQDLPGLWQAQPTEGVRPSIDDVRRRADRFARQVAWRNGREYAAALAAAAWFGFLGWRTSDLAARAGAILVVVGLAVVVWQLHARGAATRPPENFAAAGADFLRREIARQRDLLRHVWRWYLAPPLPGVALYLVAIARTDPDARVWPAALAAATVVLVFGGIWWINARAAARLQRDLEHLAGWP